MGTSLIIISYGIMAAAATVLGGFLVSSRRLGQTSLRYLIALGAGFMLAAIFFKIIPESVEMWGGAAFMPMAWLMSGYLLIQLFEHTIAPHFHFGEETHKEAMMQHHAALAGAGALMVHSFFDGVSIAVSSLVSPQLGVLIFLAILLHKLPEGFTVASMMLAAKRTARSALTAALAIGAATFTGVALVLLFQKASFWSRPLSSYILPLSAGVTLYVAASDLIPEVNKERGALPSSIVFAGVALFYISELILDTLHFEH